MLPLPTFKKNLFKKGISLKIYPEALLSSFLCSITLRGTVSDVVEGGGGHDVDRMICQNKD